MTPLQELGVGLGGGTNQYDGNSPRVQRADLRLLSTFGPVDGADVVDWPLAYVFLVREEFLGASVSLTSPTGLGGLVDGTGKGTCEICHTTTAHYRSDGSGAAHEGAWCITCHSHNVGFHPDAG